VSPRSYLGRALQLLVATMICVSLAGPSRLCGEEAQSDKQVVAAGDKSAILARAIENVTIGEVNDFHVALLDRVIYRLPNELDLSLQYHGAVVETGPLRTRSNVVLRSHSVRRVGNAGKPLNWGIVREDKFDVFTIWLSLEKTDETVATFPGRGRQLFVNVQDGTPTRFAKSKERMGGRSIGEVLRLLEEPRGND
jgi:hypothetical protein